MNTIKEFLTFRITVFCLGLVLMVTFTAGCTSPLQQAIVNGDVGKAKDIIEELSSVAEQSKDLQKQLLQFKCDFYLEVKDSECFKAAIAEFQDLISQTTSKPFEGNIALLLGRFYLQTEDLTNAEKMLKRAVYDSVVNCPHCERRLEPDYDICPECHKKNPMKKFGFI